ncbi:unnamed protein product [Cuscuta campestris]|uniref:Transposase (putative) gypsy type domain-containing protein n=1 Tax=Cuscuta campestris TaxID=132261 RepID=A0A484NFX9_9ASTE|nr:unnamed protein product [Cuscuta campestris]
MSIESSSVRTSEAVRELGLDSHGSGAQGDRAEQPGSPSVEEITAVEVPGVSEPRLQKQTLLVDSLIRECKCDLSSDEFLRVVRYAGPLVTVRRPTPDEPVFDAPPGYFAIHLKSLESGFRFPLESLVIDFFNYFDFLLCQLVPNSYWYLAGFLIRCREMGVRVDLERLMTLFRVAKSSGSDGGSFAALCQRQERLFKTKKESNKTWKSKFVFVSVGSTSPFRESPLSSFRRRSKPFASSKAIADTDKLCSGGPYEPGVLVNDEALSKFGFVFHDEDEPKRRVVQSQLEEGPSGEIMIFAADRKKLFKSKPRSESGKERPPLPTPTPSAEHAQASKKRKDVSSSMEGASLSRARSPPSRSVDCGNPAFVKVAFPLKPSFLHGDYEPRRFLQSFIPPPDRMEISSAASKDLASTLLLELGSVAMRAPELVERFEWYVAEKAKGEEELRRLQEHVAGLEGELADAEERARTAAEEKVRRLDEEAEHVVEAFQTSPEFEEAALARMDDLLKIWARTPAGQRFLFKEGQANYSMDVLASPRRLTEDERSHYFERERLTSIRVWPALGFPPREERRVRMFDLRPGRTSGYGLCSAFLLRRRSAEHECLTSIWEEHPGRVCARRKTEHECLTFIREEHPGMVCARPSS